ncbi:hypothetical protein ACHAC9_22170 [Massilia sp. CMS3.1]|uniref:hypothetical protein n=1 Tax=Massilia sp. CMS3.1 TaxID=3373083 RepID=UPI003EE718CB
MSSNNQTRIAKQDSFSFAAGVHLYKNGPMHERDLLADLASALRAQDQLDALQCAIQAGWLKITSDDKVECSPFARAHYDQLEGRITAKQMGDIALPRVGFNAYDRPPLSKKNIPNSRGMRLDMPDWSMRPAGFGFKSAGARESSGKDGT